MESSSQIEERAAWWLTRRDSGEWSDVDQAALTDWLDASVLNRVAFLRLEAAWEETNRLKALGAGLPRGKVPTISALEEGAPGADVPLRPARNARRPMLVLVAAMLVVAVISTIVYTIVPLGAERYATPVGGLSTVPLNDGSNITLNTASRVRVILTDHERHVDLVEGEAFFDVAKDAMRPFIVKAGRKNVVAVGTQFSVRRDGDEVQVVVTEGSVRVESAEGWSGIVSPDRSEEAAPAHLFAGAVARVAPAATSIQSASPGQVEELLSWRNGYVVFRETALADAVAEFNRYNERKIVIHDSHVAAMRLTGKFRANNFEAFVRLLEESFSIHAQHDSNKIVLTDPGTADRITTEAN